MPLIQVQTIDELLKLVTKQKAVTTKAMRELTHEVDSTILIYRPDRTLAESSSQELSRKIQSLLYKYTQQPTLSEFYQHPSWDGGFTYGGGFGVSTIVGTVFLKSWSEIFPEFAKIVKSVMLKVLEEQSREVDLEDEDDTPMIERVLPAMHFTIRDENGVEIIGAQRDKLVYNRVASLLQLMAQSFATYGILEIPKIANEGEQVTAKLTPFGHRVFLHLKDVEVYINEVSVLYPTLSRNKLESDSKIIQ